MSKTPISDANCFEPAAEGTMSRASSNYPRAYVPVAVCRDLEVCLTSAIASRDEERAQALREAARLVVANRLLDEALGFVNPPLADAIAEHLTKTGASNISNHPPTQSIPVTQ